MSNLEKVAPLTITTLKKTYSIETPRNNDNVQLKGRKIIRSKI
jgi:hypothetical protein